MDQLLQLHKLDRLNHLHGPVVGLPGLDKQLDQSGHSGPT